MADGCSQIAMDECKGAHHCGTNVVEIFGSVVKVILAAEVFSARTCRFFER